MKRKIASAMPGPEFTRLMHLMDISPSIAGVYAILIALRRVIPRKNSRSQKKTGGNGPARRRFFSPL